MARKSALKKALGNDPFASSKPVGGMQLLSLDPTVRNVNEAQRKSADHRTNPPQAPAPRKSAPANSLEKAPPPVRLAAPAKPTRQKAAKVKPAPLRVAKAVPSDVPSRPSAALPAFASMASDFSARLQKPSPTELRTDQLDRIDEIIDRLEKAELPSPADGLATRMATAWRYFRMFGRSMNVDDFGLDPRFEEMVQPLFDFMYSKWWRVEAMGLENIPASGRALLVGNHSGMLPWDGAMIKHAVRMHHPAHREVRPLVEDFVYHLPFLGALMARIGGVRACQENAERLLRKDELVAVFPEGVKGIGKLYRYRYQLQRFGRGGFVKLCLRTGAPLIPVSVVGAEEIHPIIARADFLARPLKTPLVPITPTLPLLGPLGLVPLPTKWFIHFGRPVDLSAYGEGALNDELLINRITSEVRAQIQEQIYEQLKKRQSVFFG
jgi:1-acyl-sn-glycerol-3-phosphate acyltransferase